MAGSGKLMAGKRGVVFGVANNRSIAWGITKAVTDQGAEVALTYQGDAIKKRVEPLAQEVGSKLVLPCDVTDEATVKGVFDTIAKEWGALDFLVHAVAFSDKEELDGRYVDTTKDNFVQTLLISCYSFTALAKRAEPLMRQGGSLLTLTYYGAEKVMPHYNVMGVAKAALEASVRYLAADLGKARSASTPSRPGRSRRSPPRASPTSATSSNGTSTIRRSGARCRSRTSARARSISCPISGAASPARSCISTPATTLSA